MKKIWLCFLLLLLGRAFTLETLDLVDPTEARYGAVAQQMILTNDWLTPKLPLPEGIEPYLGKPPFHFWLTSLSYKLFGMEEWSTRLPSFLSALAILLIVGLLSEPKYRLTGLIITFSSGLFFFSSGASVTDLTLAALVTSAIYSALLWRKTKHLGYAIAFGVFSAGAFLTKGPVSLVLILFPFIISLFSISSLSEWKGFPIFRTLGIFIILVTPWFVLSEIANPGFLKYFIWNENLARYLITDYGDRYGSGHVHFRGMSWVMLALGFLPWSVPLIPLLIKNRKSLDTESKFLLIWGLSAPLFFTFARQLHALYLLPAIPPLALLTSKLLSEWSAKYSSLSIWLPLWLILAMIGICLSFSYSSVLLVIIALLLGTFISTKESSHFTFGSRVIVTYFIVILAFSSYINERRSVKVVLQRVISKEPMISEIGVSTRNSFSHYWVASAWKTELQRPISIKYVSPGNEASLGYYLFKGKDWRKAPRAVLKGFKLIQSSGEWHVFKRI